MKKFILLCLVIGSLYADKPVFKNPGIPAREILIVDNYINKDIGFAPATINILLQEDNGKKYYYIEVAEGGIYLNKIKVNYDNLTMISEKRYDAKTGQLLEEFSLTDKGLPYLYNRKKEIKKNYSSKDLDENCYPRYAYFFSFRGFPFGKKEKVYFKSYLFEYPLGPLTMKLENTGKKNIVINKKLYQTYRLKLTVAGWQRAFSKDKWYFYFEVKKPHQFLKFDQKVDDGRWLSNRVLEFY